MRPELLRGTSVTNLVTRYRKIAAQAEAYRRRAEEIRTTAENMTDAVCIATMNYMAAGYERLARNMEKMGAPFGEEVVSNTPAAALFSFEDAATGR